MVHRLLIPGCKTMRDGVVASSSVFVAAILLFLAAPHDVPPILPVAGHIGPLFALILIVMAPVILLSARPGAREKLEKCEH